MRRMLRMVRVVMMRRRRRKRRMVRKVLKAKAIALIGACIERAQLLLRVKGGRRVPWSEVPLSVGGAELRAALINTSQC
ncbi:hypothetical protein BDW71DRAFT_174992 [Aspergillus fruticulosus]